MEILTTNPLPPATPPAPTLPPVDDLRDPALYLNRELSLLEFNRRVLELAKAPHVPLLERLRFLTICSSNLDEFFEIRVAGLRQQRSAPQPGLDGRTPEEVLERVSQMAHELVADQYRVLQDDLLPTLEREGIRIRFRDSWTQPITDWSRELFRSEIQPVVTPMALDPSHPFPLLVNKTLAFMVSLEGTDAFGRSTRLALLQAPRILPRLMPIPPAVAGSPNQFATLSGIINTNMHELFPGMRIVGSWPFRVTRDSDLWIDEEESDDLLLALKGELPNRQFGTAVRLEVGRDCPTDVAKYLLDQFELEDRDLFRVSGPVNLHRLALLYGLVDRPDLKYAGFVPAAPAGLGADTDLFDAIRRADVLLHHPYQSFVPVKDLLEQAARDPKVLAIKITLYRTGADLASPLIEAARNRKEVTAVIELRARFDEETNIDLATRLQEAGANVVYGVVGYKAHAKMLCIVRREDDGIRRYVHLGTGNYHPRNARQYTDFGLLTADPDIGQDVHELFQQITGLGTVARLKKLLQSPFTLHAAMLAAIESEIESARLGRPARIRAKMNALIDPEIIRALYRASRAGVRVDLVVRGACCLRPGIPGLSENIRVVSVVGRFLEHARVFNFHADGKEITWCSSADWMPRNFFRRIEVAFPIEDPELRRRTIDDGLDRLLADERDAWELASDGSYRQREPRGERAAQRELLELLPGRAAAARI